MLARVREIHVEHPHVVRLEARPANVEGAGEVTLETLVRQALRMRPDRIVVGEVRGAEVRELLAALNTGHEGGCGTVHANAPEDVVARFEALGALAGLGPEAVRAQLAAAVDLVIHVARHRRLDDPHGPGGAATELEAADPGRAGGTRHVSAIAAVFRRESGPCIVPALVWDGPGRAWSRGAAWPALAARLGLSSDSLGPGDCAAEHARGVSTPPAVRLGHPAGASEPVDPLEGEDRSGVPQSSPGQVRATCPTGLVAAAVSPATVDPASPEDAAGAAAAPSSNWTFVA